MSFYFISVQIRSLNCRDVDRWRHKFQNSIQKLLNSLIPVCGSAANRNRRTFTGSFSQTCFQLIVGRLFPFQIHHHQVVVQLTDFFYQLWAVKFSLILHIVGNFHDRNILAFFIVINISFHLKQIDDSFEFIFFADRKLDADSIFSKSCLDLLYRTVKIRAQNVHLIDECHSRYVVSVRLTPYVFRLRLYSTLCTKDAYCAVKYTEWTLNFHRKVNVSRRINNIDTVFQCTRLRFAFFLFRPVTCRSGWCDCNSSLLLLFHPVHGSSSFMSITNFIINTGIIQNTFRKSRLTRIYMSHDTDIPGSL